MPESLGHSHEELFRKTAIDEAFNLNMVTRSRLSEADPLYRFTDGFSRWKEWVLKVKPEKAALTYFQLIDEYSGEKSAQYATDFQSGNIDALIQGQKGSK